MAIFKAAVPKIDTMQVLFVTSSREDLQLLETIGEQAREISYNITKQTWQAKGYDIECFSPWSCESCPDREVCSEIQTMIKVRKKSKADKDKDKPAS